MAKALSIVAIPDEDLERLRIGLRSLFRWDRSARLALESGHLDAVNAAAITGPMDHATS